MFLIETMTLYYLLITSQEQPILKILFVLNLPMLLNNIIFLFILCTDFIVNFQTCFKKIFFLIILIINKFYLITVYL